MASGNVRLVMQRSEVAPRFWAKVKADGTGCWPWQAGLSTSGYGKFWLDCKHRAARAHRVAYELVKGPIPRFYTIDHLCRVRRCVNPSHLEAVTNRENVLRGEGHTARNARKTECPQGHEYDEANTYTSSDGERHCRACGREASRRSWAKRQPVGHEQEAPNG